MKINTQISADTHHRVPLLIYVDWVNNMQLLIKLFNESVGVGEYEISLIYTACNIVIILQICCNIA